MGCGASKESAPAAPPSGSNKAKSATKAKSGSAAPLISTHGGKKFSDVYKMGKELGSGAFSVVKEGTQKASGESYAIKIVTKTKLSEEDEAALKDEIAVLKDMKHPNIIMLYDVFEEKEYYFLVTEKMTGGELFDRIVQKSYYNEKEARDTCVILFGAIQHCHSKSVAHRDLKPENLLLQSADNDSNIKIADFGFAKKCNRPSSLTTQCGTPGYVAPEILEGTPYDTRADMWSLGVIVYILLGGYPPFIEQNQRDLFRKIRKGQYEFHEEYWGQVSPEAKGMISSLLCVKMDKRLTADGSLKHAWIKQSDDALISQDLGANLEKFKAFNAKRKFKAAVKTVMLTQKLNSLGLNFKQNL
mmetsp:Transcript_17337/g.22537  ORF Transcript_17337/g.22537 Transcript_17337/m.22537 type:complete len:358 (-) Transcript_17337:550-1623(-)|eukprot:CAMPEP_0198140834 /NCGR_PEP_ID=MMETSP1443-20131203/3918_1 /TAXON_ID=186043 /ORGANISM="Entomoneis sp., Strain CCMP2396" /LENGTH=357 /DNA_ID=CAMNT_0043803369 /DNA_START=206 /DNA_END=1279 /DNA_ORIENTATION=+